MEPLRVYATFEGEIQSWSRFESSLIFRMGGLHKLDDIGKRVGLCCTEGVAKHMT